MRVREERLREGEVDVPFFKSSRLTVTAPEAIFSEI
jgi:hypothetical protein